MFDEDRKERTKTKGYPGRFSLPMKVFSSKKHQLRVVLFSVIAIIVLGLLYLSIQWYLPFIFNTEELRIWISQFGPLAPLVFIILQTTQVVIAPIPGQALALVSGYLFGSVAGTIYSLLGVLLGSAIAFSLTKRYGRSFVEDVLHEDLMTRFDGFVDRVGIPGLLVFILIPGLPDDAICFLCGLTKMSLRMFLIVISIGRLPAYVLTVYAGGELASGQFISALLLIGVVIVLSAIGYYKQDTIRQFVQQLNF